MLWIEFKKLIIERDNNICQYCKEPINFNVKDLKASIHHIVPRRKGGKDIPDHVILVHIKCHRLIEKNLFKEIKRYKIKIKILRMQIKYERKEMTEEQLQDLKYASLERFKWFCNWMDEMMKKYGYGQVA